MKPQAWKVGELARRTGVTVRTPHHYDEIGLLRPSWHTETTFAETRAYLGLETTQGWTRATVLRAAPCLFGLSSVVAMLYAELPAGAAAEWAVTYRGKAEVTFSDAIGAVRRRLWSEGLSRARGQTEDTAGGFHDPR